MMKINFFTWNIGNNKLLAFFQNLNAQLEKDEIDVLVLQEYTNDEHTKELINYKEVDDFVNEKGRRWVRVFINKKSSLDYNSMVSYASNKVKCFELTCNSSTFKINIIAVHLYSRVGKSRNQQQYDNKDIPEYIREFETKQKNEMSLIVGDLNYTPFDIELSQPHFFNAIGDRHLINLLKTRDIRGRSIKYFYNPMWNLLGDYNYITKTPKSQGTYYWFPDDIDKYHWNLIDGVLLSPEIMNNIDIESIRILNEINGLPLIKSSIEESNESILTNECSDHLPISFTIEI